VHGNRLPNADYFTDDYEDAEQTANAMVSEFDKGRQFNTYVSHVNESLPEGWYIHMYASKSFSAYLLDPDGNETHISAGESELLKNPADIIRHLLITAQEESAK